MRKWLIDVLRRYTMVVQFMVMLLFFDARYIRTDFHDGISRYSTELGNALAKLTPLTFLISDMDQLKQLPPGAKYIKIHAPTELPELAAARVINKYNPDVVFSPMQTLNTTGRKFKLILTSHDMIYYRHRLPPRNLNPVIKLGWRMYHLTYGPQRRALNGADMVATVSHASQREFEAARLTKRPIIVIPNAPQKLETLVDKVDQSKAPKNLIYMGSFMPYKNVETLIAGMKYLPNHTLHLLSKVTPIRKLALEKLIPKSAKVVFHNGVSDEAYAKLLANRGVLVTASFDEGYGLPIAEALALGVPAVVSDIAIFHEVAAGGALYFEPNDPKDFAKKVEELNDSTRRHNLIEHGKGHANTFSWRASAQALLNAINSLK
jgi:glycosyltransferase involved in cell wall biosynthesis